jgi:hypothetical protein
MNDQQNHISPEDCAFEVTLMARRAALLHYYFSEAIIAELGEEKGREVIKKAIWDYGEHCGRTCKEGVEAMGLPLTEENYGKIRDLPRFGWKTGMITMPDGEERQIAPFCPIAAAFEELGPRAVELGRMYCFVDQAKYHAYNPDIEFVHSKNVLDGDEYCEFQITVKHNPE